MVCLYIFEDYGGFCDILYCSNNGDGLGVRRYLYEFDKIWICGVYYSVDFKICLLIY